jgi:hypothetical protein
MPTAPTSATTGLKILQQGPTPIPDTFNQTTNPINPHATGLEEGAIITPITSFTQAGSRLRDSSSQRNSSILYNASEDERRRNFLQEKLDNQYNTFLRRTQGKGRLFDVDRLIDKQASIRSRNKSMGLVGDLESVYGNLATWSDEFNDINLEMEYNKRISSGLDAFTPDLREAEGDLKQLFKNEKDRRGIKTRELNRRERNEIAKTYSRRVSLGRDPVQGSFLERWADKLPPVLDAIPIVTDTLNAFASQAGISASEYTRMSDEEKDNFKTAVKPAFKQGFVDALPIINKMATKKEGSFTVRGSSLLYDDIYVGNLKQTHGEQVGGNVGYIGGGIAGNVALYSAMSPILEAGILRASQGLKTAQATAKLQRSVKGSRVALGEDIAAIYSPSRLQQWAATNPLAFRMSVVNVAEETTQAIAMKTSGQEYTATDFYMGMLLGAGIEVVFDMVRARPGWRHLNQKSFVDQARADLETHVGDYFETFGSYRDVNRFGDFIGDQKIGTTGQTWDSMFKESRLIYYRDPEIRRRAGSGDLSDPQARYWRAVQKADGSAQFEEVRGAKKTRSLPNVDAFTYKAEDGVWHVIEERSGTSIGRADTRGGAIESAQTKLKEFEAGGGNFTALVQNAIDSNGISPRHAEPVTSKTSLPSGDPISPREREAFIDEVRRRVPRERLSENVNMEDIYQVQKALELTHDHGSFQPAAKDPNVKNIPKGTRKAAVSPEEIIAKGAQKKSGLRGIIKDLKDKSGVTPTPDRLIALEVSEAEKLIPANFRGSIDELRPLLRENGISDEAINRMRLVGRPLKDSVEMDADGKFEVDPRFWDDQLLAKAEGQIVEPPDPRALGDDFWSQARSGIHEVEQALMPTEVYANMVDGRPLTYDGVFMRTYMWPAQEASGTAFKNWYEWRTRHADARGDLTPEDVNATYWYGITQMEPPKESAFRTMRELVQYNLDRINTRARQSNPEHVDIVVPDGLSDGQQKLYSFWRKSMDDIHPEMNKASVDSTGEEVGFIERFLPIEIEKDELLAASIIADGKPPPYIKRRTPEFSHLNERRLSDLLLKQDSFTLMERYMQKAQYFTQVAPLGSRMKHAFEQPEFGQIYGRGAQKYFSDSWMQDFLRGNKTVSSPAWKSVNKFKSHVSSYALAFRIPSYLKQYMAGFNSSAKMDAVAGKAGTGLSYMKRGIRMRSDPEVRKLHLEMSEHLGRRVPDIAFTQLEAPKGDSVRDVLNGWSDIGLKPLKNADFEVAMSAHIAAKEFAVDELGKSLDEAMKFADSVVRTTQGSTDFENLPQAFKNDWGLLMMHFQTFVNANFNFVKEDLVKAGIIQQKAPPSAVAAGFTSVMMGVMLEKAISDQYYEFKTGREPRFSGNFLSWKYFATLGTDFIPGLSATGEGSPLGRTFGNLVTGVEGTRPDRAVKSAAALYGLPGGAQTADIYDFLFRKER